MTFLKAFTVAFQALAVNTLRSILAVLGIVIGVAAVIAMQAMGKGAQVQVEQSISSMGANLIFIWPGMRASGHGMARQSAAETLTLDDVDALQKLPHISSAAPEVSRNYQLKYMARNTNARVLGTTPAFFGMRHFKIDHGACFDKTDLAGRRRVCILGARLARDLFNEVDPVGRLIQIDRKNFLVLAVLEFKGGDQWMRLDDSAYVPVTTAVYRLANQRFIHQITVAVDATEHIEAAMEGVKQELMRRHRTPPNEDPDFSMSSMDEIRQRIQQTTGAFALLLACIAFVSLLVGGIGIMNVMLVSVAERTREIGIRKAIGARRSDILKQFLIESVAISLIGGVLGIALGVAGAQLIPMLPIWSQLSGGRGGWVSVVSWDSILLAAVFSCSVGVFFGLYPALRAARLNPVEALRYE